MDTVHIYNLKGFTGANEFTINAYSSSHRACDVFMVRISYKTGHADLVVCKDVNGLRVIIISFTPLKYQEIVKPSTRQYHHLVGI